MSRRRNKLIALGLVHLGHKFIFRTAELLGERCRKPPFEGQVLTRCGIRTKVQEQCRGAGRKWKRIPHAASNGGEGTAVGAGTDVTRWDIWRESELARVARVKVLLASVNHEFVLQVYSGAGVLAISPRAASPRVRRHFMSSRTYAATQTWLSLRPRRTAKSAPAPSGDTSGRS